MARLANFHSAVDLRSRRARLSRCGVGVSAMERPPTDLEGSGSGVMPGIVRDMDVAHEAYRDVLAAVPGMTPEPEPDRR